MNHTTRTESAVGSCSIGSLSTNGSLTNIAVGSGAAVGVGEGAGAGAGMSPSPSHAATIPLPAVAIASRLARRVNSRLFMSRPLVTYQNGGTTTLHWNEVSVTAPCRRYVEALLSHAAISASPVSGRSVKMPLSAWRVGWTRLVSSVQARPRS